MTYTTIYQGHALDVLKQTPGDSISMCCTSPPYYGQRDYGLPPVMWGGDRNCKHEWAVSPPAPTKTARVGSDNYAKHPNMARTQNGKLAGQFCRLCGAWRGCLGLEPLHDCSAWARGERPCPACYVCHIRTIWEQVGRVLHPSGTVFLNIGDSYSGSGGRLPHHANKGLSGSTEKGSGIPTPVPPGLKQKDLMMMPARVAMALQADGWWLRSEISWVKANPLPESVRDRPTSATEKIYLLAKSSRYFYDADAVRTPHKDTSVSRYQYGHSPPDDPTGKVAAAARTGAFSSERMGNFVDPKGANMRNYVMLASEAFPGAHFATFPTKIPEVAILAGTSEKGVCAKCYAPWERVTCSTSPHGSWDEERDSGEESALQRGHRITKCKDATGPMRETVGWQPTCECSQDEATPAMVLDPFGGAMTTALVAARLGRNSIMIELSDEYIGMGVRRLQDDMPLLNQITVRKLKGTGGYERNESSV